MDDRAGEVCDANEQVLPAYRVAPLDGFSRHPGAFAYMLHRGLLGQRVTG